MRKDLEPSADVSGGPWYTDHELDTAFIESHSEAILVYIRSRVCYIVSGHSHSVLLIRFYLINSELP